jgi:MioC protein
MQIEILVGTMTGTAELCAEEMVDALDAAGRSAEMLLMDDLDAAVFDPAKAYIICTSTYGHGDVPDNARALFKSLSDKRPDLTGLAFGVFALGDITHGETFCFGGIGFDKILTELGANRVGDISTHDASSGELPEDQAGDWAAAWAETLNSG